MHDALPRTAAALDASSAQGVPDDAVFAALGADLLAAKRGRLRYSTSPRRSTTCCPAARSHVLRAARGVAAGGVLTRATLIAADPFWGESETWFAIRNGVRRSPRTTCSPRSTCNGCPDGGIGPLPADQAIYRAIFARTFVIAAGVTLITLVLGFPARLAARQPAGADRRAADHAGAAAVLDLDPGAHGGLDGAAAEIRNPQRAAARPRTSSAIAST